MPCRCGSSSSSSSTAAVEGLPLKTALVPAPSVDNPIARKRARQATGSASIVDASPLVRVIPAHERPTDVRRRFPDGEVHVAEVALVVGTDGAVSVESKRQPNDVAVESREAVGIGRVQGER